MKKHIYSMSTSKSKLGDYLESHTRPVVEHLIKLYLYPDRQYTTHWRREVARYLNSINTLKGSHKLPSAKFIFDNTYKVHEKFMRNYTKQILYEYGKSEYLDYALDDIEYETMVSHIKNYFLWIASELSEQVQIPYPEIYNKLDDLGL